MCFQSELAQGAVWEIAFKPLNGLEIWKWKSSCNVLAYDIIIFILKKNTESVLLYVSSGGTLINYLWEPWLRMMTARTGRDKVENVAKKRNKFIWDISRNLRIEDSNIQVFILFQIPLDLMGTFQFNSDPRSSQCWFK